MGLISIGSHTFTRNPASMTPLEAQRFNAHLLTYSSVAHFSWGFSIVGKEIILRWPFMSNTEYEQVRTVYLDDELKILNPNDGSGTTYNVQMTNFNGMHYRGRGSATTASRLNITLELLIISVN